MKTAKIKDLFEIDRSSKIRAKEGILNGSYPFYTSGKSIKSLYTYQYNTRGLIIGTGGNPNLHFADGTFSISSDCCLLTSKQEYVDVKYAYYFLCAKPSILQRLFKGAGIKHISVSDIREVEIEYPDLSIQHTIITIMSFLDEIIEKRINIKEQFPEVLLNYYLSVTDKSNGWDEVPIDKILLDIKSGPFGSQLRKNQIFENGNIYVLGIDDVKNKVVSRFRASYLSDDELDRYKRYLVKENDVLFSMMGTVGCSAVVPKGFGKAINTKHLAAITVNVELCNPYFLSYALMYDPYVKAQFQSCKRGAIMNGINLSDLKGIRIKLPNVKAQALFDKIYALYRDIENKMIQELSLLEELRISLLNQFFLAEVKDNLQLLENIHHHSKTDIAAVVRLIEQGGFADIANYDEMRKLLYEYLDKEIVTQIYDEESQTIKFRIDETHKA